MKTLNITVILLLASTFCFGQTISESLVNLRKKYNPLFSGESAVITVDYVKQYQMNSTDTTYSVIIKVNNESVEQQSFSIGTSIFGSITSGGTYKVDKQAGEVVFNKENLMDFYECANNIYKFISSRSNNDKAINTVTYCEIENITIAAELVYYASGSQEVKYYFRVGDSVVFQMDKNEFEQIMRTFVQIKKDWEQR